MPFTVDEGFQGGSLPQGGLPSEEPAPKPLDVAAAAFRQFNTIVSGYNYLNARAGLTPDPNYVPLEDPQVKGTDIERNHLDWVATSQSAAETQRRISEGYGRETDLQMVAREGWPGTVMAIAAGSLDPTLFTPMGAAFDILKGGISGLRAGVALGAISAVTTTAQEAVLAATHPGVTAREAAANIGSATLMGGILGYGIHFLSPAARVMLEKRFSDDRVAMGNDIAGAPAAAARNALSIDPATVRGPDVIPALKIGGEVFIGDSHAEALDRAIQQFGANSPEIKAFNDAEKPLESIGVIRDRQFRPNVSGDQGAEVLQKAREAAAAAPPVTPPESVSAGAVPPLPQGNPGFAQGGYDAARVGEIQGGSIIGFDNLQGHVRLIDGQEIPVAIGGGAIWDGKGNEIDPGAILEFKNGAGDQWIPVKRPGAPQAPGEVAAAVPPAEALTGEVLPPAGRAVAAAGAQAADLRTLDDLTLRPTFGVAEFINKTPWLKTIAGSPVTQGLMSPYLAMRKAMADLAESPLETMGNLRNVTTTRGGAATDRLVRLHLVNSRAEIVTTMDRAYAKYAAGREDMNYLGQQVTKMKGFIGRVQDTPGRKLSFGEFDKQVGIAMSDEDMHVIPEVREAAENLRDLVRQWLDRANEQREAGRLIAEVPRNAKSYFPIYYDKPAIKGDRPFKQNAIADDLQADQERKAHLQEQLQTEWANLQIARHEGQKLDSRVATAERRLGEIETRLSERGQEAAAALKRASTLAERNMEAGAAMQDMRDFVTELKASSPDTPEVRQQISDLQDGISEIERGSQLISEKDLASVDKAEREGILTGNMRRAARVATGKMKPPAPPTFWRWIVDNGGLSGITAQELKIDPLKAPTLVRTEAGKGMSMDDLETKMAAEFPELRARGYGAQKSKEAQDFSDEIKDAIEQSVPGPAGDSTQPDWFLNEKWNEDDRFVTEMAAMIDDVAGRNNIELKTVNDVADLFRGEHHGMTESDYDAIVKELEQSTAAPVVRAEAEGMQNRIAIRQGSFDIFKDSLANARQKAAAAQTQARVTGAREGEAQIPVGRNLGRLGILNERARIGQKQYDMLAAYRGQQAADELTARANIEALLKQWEGKSAREAQSALEQRAKEESLRATASYMRGGQGTTVTMQTKAGPRTYVRPEPTERLTSADDAVDRAVRQIIDESRTVKNKDRSELMADAGEIIDKGILGSPDGRLPYDMNSGGPNVGWTGKGGRLPERGPLAGRTFMMAQKAMNDAGMLHTSAMLVLDRMLHTMVPDVIMAERHGDVLMTRDFEAIRQAHEAAVLRTVSEDRLNSILAKKPDAERQGIAVAAAQGDNALKAALSPEEWKSVQMTPADRQKLDKAYDEDVANLAGVRDRIRHVYGWTDDYFMQNAGRILQGVRKAGTAMDLGAVAASSMFDFAGTIWRTGLETTLRSAWIPFLQRATTFDGGIGLWKANTQELKAMGIGWESLLGDRSVYGFENMLEPYGPQSKLERGIYSAVDLAMQATLIGPETDLAKRGMGSVAMHNMLTAIEGDVDGTVSLKNRTLLRASGIDQQMSERIWREYSRPEGGNEVDGTRVPNTASWDDRGAREAFQGAIGRETDIGVITPGQEKPFWMSRILGASIGQYRGFVAASTERLLLAMLQRHDFQTLQGLVALFGIGVMLTKFYSVINNKPMPDTPGGLIKEAMSRAGIFGWFEEGNNILSKATGGAADMYRLIGATQPASKYVNRDIGSAVLGPTWAKLQSVVPTADDIAHLTWTAADTRRIRRFGFLQNHPLVRQLYDAAESGVNQATGNQ